MLTSVIFGLAFVAASVVGTLLIFLATRRAAGEPHESHTKGLAASVIGRIGGLLGLILALVFAQELTDYQQLRTESAVEANAIADVYFDAARFGTEQKGAIQDTLYDYVKIVRGEEWDHLGQTGRLSGKAWAAWDKVYNQVLDLQSGNDRQRSLRDNMLRQVHIMSEARVRRENHTGNSISFMFWFAAVTGVILIAVSYYTYPATRRNLVLVSLYATYTGLILLFIYAFQNPFSAPGRLDPDAFTHLQAQLDAARGS